MSAKVITLPTPFSRSQRAAWAQSMAATLRLIMQLDRNGTGRPCPCGSVSYPVNGKLAVSCRLCGKGLQ